MLLPGIACGHTLKAMAGCSSLLAVTYCVAKFLLYHSGHFLLTTLVGFALRGPVLVVVTGHVSVREYLGVPVTVDDSVMWCPVSQAV